MDKIGYWFAPARIDVTVDLRRLARDLLVRTPANWLRGDPGLVHDLKAMLAQWFQPLPPGADGAVAWDTLVGQWAGADRGILHKKVHALAKAGRDTGGPGHYLANDPSLASVRAREAGLGLRVGHLRPEEVLLDPRFGTRRAPRRPRADEEAEEKRPSKRTRVEEVGAECVLM